MDTYKELGNLSENLMIRKMQKKLYNEENKGRNNDNKKNNRIECKKEGGRTKQCVFCGRKNNLYKYLGNYYCYKCFRELKELSGKQ